jgi:D-alanyl-D-alanine carboxypeptidase (penicillin-binding protein 5/6)
MKLLFAVVLALLALATARAQPVNVPPIAARAYLLVDTLSGQTLAAANEDDRVEPASLTKLMTAYVVFGALRDGKLDPAKPVRVSARAAAAEGSRMYLTNGTSVSIDELLRGMIVQSGNDAAIALAEAVAGSEDAFVAVMNAQARHLKLGATRFANATGRPAPEHYSTARDLAALAAAVVREFPERYSLYAVKEFRYNGIAQSNRNRLLWIDATVDGMKTGFTEAAGYCIVASAKRGERRLIAVVLGAQSDTLRTSESQKLLNFGFQAYETRRLYVKLRELE